MSAKLPESIGLVNGSLAVALRREMARADIGNKVLAGKIGRSEDTVERLLRGEHVKYSTLCQVYKVFPVLETVPV